MFGLVNDKIDNLRKRLLEQFKEYGIEGVMFFDVMEFSGISNAGLSIKVKGRQIMPFLFDSDEDDFEEKEVIEYFKDELNNKTDLVVVLHNYEVYKNNLEKIPHRKVFDMAAVVKYLEIGDDENPEYRDVTYEKMKSMDMTEDELFENALKCMYEKSGILLKSVSELSELMKSENEELIIDDEAMDLYFLTNHDFQFGTSLIMVEEVAEKIYEKIGDFYLLPANINECLIVPKVIDNSAIKHMRDMMIEINDSILKPEERSSEKILYLNRQLSRFEELL